jgi:hypothetical protein
LTPFQANVLRRVLTLTLFPSTQLRMFMSKELGMPARTIQIWFQNQVCIHCFFFRNIYMF